MSQHQEVRREYIIVDFPEEKTGEDIPMALISSDWMFEERGNLYCHWPTYLKSTTQREKAVIQHQQLKHDKCIKCPVAVKYSTDDYKKACMKLRLLEEEQSQSEESSSQLFSRREIGNRKDDFIYSDESFDDDDVPVPPKIKITPSVPSPIIEKHSRTLKKKTYTLLKPVEPFEQNTRLNIENNNEVSINNNHCTCEKNTRILRDLVREVQILKDDIRHLLRLHADKENYEMDAKTVQIQRYEKLKEFDIDLKDEEYFKKCLTKLGLVGGKDVAETTRKILRLMISHELAISLNWSGRNNKHGLEALENVVTLIHGSVRRNPLAKHATNVEINNSIMNWLRNASDRAGGRSRRAEGKEINN